MPLFLLEILCVVNFDVFLFCGRLHTDMDDFLSGLRIMGIDKYHWGVYEGKLFLNFWSLGLIQVCEEAINSRGRFDQQSSEKKRIDKIK